MVIGLEVTGLKKTGVVSLLGLLEARGEKLWCGFVCVERLGLMIGIMLVLLISLPREVFTYGNGMDFKNKIILKCLNELKYAL